MDGATPPTDAVAGDDRMDVGADEATADVGSDVGRDEAPSDVASDVGMGDEDVGADVAIDAGDVGAAADVVLDAPTDAVVIDRPLDASECATGADCPAGRICASNRCVTPAPCMSSRMCPGQVCDTPRSICVDCVGDVDCMGGQVCRGNSCVAPPRPCRSSRECSDLNLVCDATRGFCVECVTDTDCAMGQFCAAGGTCATQRCPPSSRSCASPTRVRECDARGTALTERDCPAATSCVMGACQTRVCTPGEASCASATERRTCNLDGLSYTSMTCPAGQSCVLGVCMARVCVPGEASCASPTERRTCNPDGQGYTTTMCVAPAGNAVMCVGGVCRVTCATGFADCDGNSANGCETSIFTDASNCGRCGGVCPTPANSRSLCATGGTCTLLCLTGFADCDGNAANGCEAPLNTDANCGACGVRCTAAEACEGGRCMARPTCLPPLRACGARCVDLRSDALHCGVCGTRCATGEVCVLGRCAPSVECDSRRGLQLNGTTCSVQSGDAAACGGSSSRCGFNLSQAVCSGNGCAEICSAGLTTCGRDCANLLFNPAHCGRCDNRCLPGQLCYGGACITANPCAPPFVSCGGACVDTRSDALHCGACGTRCATGEVCVLGRCAPSVECDSRRGLQLNGTTCRVQSGDAAACGGSSSRCGFNLSQAVCNGNSCAEICSAGLTTCGRDCANLLFNPAHCGRCDNRCLPGQLCYGGACITANPCAPPFVSCGGACVDTRSDALHCGACGTRCATGEVCVLGRCAPSVECDSRRGLQLNGTTCRVQSGDAAACGGSSSRCGFNLSQAVCNGNSCAEICSAGLTTCGRDCANLLFNPAHCGRCDNRCLPGQLCYGGACITANPCAPPFVSCGGACVDTRSDALHCGACGTRCATGEVCVLGRCAPSVECDSRRGLQLNGTTCRVQSGDAAACGGSSSRCGFNLSQAVCSGNGCAEICSAGLTTCGRDCANLLFNPAHCGRCDNRCLPGQLCYGGACITP